MFWFFAVCICIFEAFWYLRISLACPTLKTSKLARPLILMGSLCSGFKTCVPWAGLLTAKVPLVLPTPREVRYLWVLTVGILWIALGMSHLRQPQRTLTAAASSSPALNPFCTNTSDGSLSPSPARPPSCVPVSWPGWVAVGLIGQAGAASSWPFQNVRWSVLKVWRTARLYLYWSFVCKGYFFSSCKYAWGGGGMLEEEKTCWESNTWMFWSIFIFLI